MSRTGAEVYCGHYGIVQNGLLLVGKFYGVVYFGCTVCHGDSFRTLRERYYRLDTKNITSSVRTRSFPPCTCYIYTSDSV